MRKFCAAIIAAAAIYCTPAHAVMMGNRDVEYIYNPQTARPDLITAISTRNVVAGSGVTVVANSTGVTISATGGSGASSLSVQDEGVNISSPTSTINFVGAGVTVTATGTSSATVTIPGGASSGNSTVVAVSSNNIIVSSPTTNINFMPPFIVALQGSTSAQITLNSSSVTLQGVLNEIHNQSTLQSGSTAYPDFIYAGSSGTIPNLKVLVALKVVDGTGATVLNSDTTRTTAVALRLSSLSNAVLHVNGSGDLFGGLVSLSTETTGIYVASVTVSSALTLTGTNNVAGAAPIFSANSSSITLQGNAVSIAAHATRHQDGGADELSVTGLSGLLADRQMVAISTGGSLVNVSSGINFAASQFLGSSVTIGGNTLVSLNGSSVTLQGNAFNGNSQLLQLDGSALVPSANVPTTLAAYIQNRQTLQSGATAYPDFLYVGSSGSVYGPFVMTSTGAAPALKLVANGIYGVSAGTSGGLLVDCSGGGAASGMCAQIYSIAGAQIALGGLLNVISASNTFNEPAIYTKQTSTNGGAANERHDGPAPQIEFVENDQASPAGKYELGVNGDIFYIDGRNSADNAFENIFRVVRKAASGGGYAATLSSAPFRFFDGTSAHYVSLGSSNTVASNVNWILPPSDRVGVIQSDGAGNLFLTPASTIAVAAVGISQLSATGSPSATTFLRGDNTWIAPAGSGDAVLAATQTFSGADTFTSSVTFVGRILDSTLSAGTSAWVLTSRGNSVGAQWMPGGSGTGDITDVFNCASGDCNSIVMADGDLLDASGIIPSATTEGIIITTGTDCTSMTARGQLCYDTDNLKLSIGSGTANPVIVNQTVISLLPETAQFLTVNFPQLSRSTTTFPTSFLAYDATTDETAFWKFSVPNYSTGPAQVTVYWHADSSTQGAVTWEMQFSTKTPNVDTGDMESGGNNIVFGAISGTTTVHPGLPVKRLLSTTWMATYEQMARMKSGDLVMVRLARDANATNGTDSLAGDAKLDYCEIKW